MSSMRDYGIGASNERSHMGLHTPLQDQILGGDLDDFQNQGFQSILLTSSSSSSLGMFQSQDNEIMVRYFEFHLYDVLYVCVGAVCSYISNH